MRLARLSLVLAFLYVVTNSGTATAQTTTGATLHEARTNGEHVADALSSLTGVSLSPLMGMSALGVVTYFGTDESQRDALPWFDQPYFWLTGIALMLFLFAGHRVPWVDHFFKSAKLWENKASAALAIPVVALGFAEATGRPMGEFLASAWNIVEPSAYAVGPEHIASHAVSFVGEVVAFGVGLVAASAVWMAGHNVNVAALLIPFQPVAVVLKGMRLALILFLVIADKLSPTLGAFVSVIYIVCALFLAGWSFRLMVFGVVFTSDILLLRWRRTTVEPGPVLAFSSAAFTDVPVRTFGTLHENDTGITFIYRPWLVGTPRECRVDGKPAISIVGKGLVSPLLLRPMRGTKTEALFRLPPRYRTHSDAIAHVLGDLPVKDVSFGRGIRAAIAWVREQLSWGGRRPTSAVA